MSTVKRKCQVVMLPTKKASDIILRTKDDIMHHRRFYGAAWEDMGDVYQHLYILSDDEIKEGDWFIVELFKISGESDGFHIEQCTKTDAVWINNYDVIKTRHRENCKKIIATTDSSLGLAQPSGSFIQKYIDAYNSGNPITNVMVEYDYFMCENGHTMNYKTACVYPMCGKINHQIPKINLKNNTITISKVKDSWTREEMEISHLQMSVDITKHIIGGGSLHTFDTLKWIEENL